MTTPMRTKLVRIALSGATVAALFFGSPRPAAAVGAGACVDLTATATGPTTAVLAWGSASIPLVVKTNATFGYTLTVNIKSLTGGIVIGAKDVSIALEPTSTKGAVAAKTIGQTATATSTLPTDKTGDVITVKLSTWQPIGSPRVAISYTLVTRTSSSCK